MESRDRGQDFTYAETAPSRLPAFDDEYYEDTLDMNMKAYAMTEDEWAEQEEQKMHERS